jgi:A/G-specific adenine glycosylase
MPPVPPAILAFRRQVLRWFRRQGRDLPWRRTRDPYAILVSEFMLQQTQVSRVTEYYPRFLERYPTVHALAGAAPDQVRDVWQGLGYYRRAANLHRLAQVVVEEHAGQIPREPDTLIKLPGVGRYPAGAVATFAFERSTPAVDTNVSRVIRRAFHPGAKGSAGDKRVWATGAALVPRAGNAAWSFNQGIMELGALVCTARVAHCLICPVRAVCKTAKRGRKSG